MAKQDKSKFQLNKGTDHGFDISKGGKRKFDLTKDADEPVAASENASKQANSTTSTQSTPEPTPKQASSGSLNQTMIEPQEKKNSKWLWIILAFIAIILLIWWLFIGKDTDSKPMVEEETVEEVTIPADTVSEEIALDTVLPKDKVENAVSENTDIPTTPAANSTQPTSLTQTTNTAANASSIVSSDVEAEAIKVIRGEYGIGQERKNRLGSQYEAIQNRVNEMKREGVF